MLQYRNSAETLDIVDNPNNYGELTYFQDVNEESILETKITWNASRICVWFEYYVQEIL